MAKSKKANRPTVAYMPLGGEGNIAWIPHIAEQGYWLSGCLFTTFGTAQHAGNGDQVAVPELGITDAWGLDPEIAPLIIALNRAGVETVQSCQDISSFFEGDVYDDTVRMGIILVGWEDFPKVKRTLPLGASGEGQGDGWLFAASPDADYVSVLFPWRDYGAWLEAASLAAK
jgi:hypothetical protein